MVFIQERDVYDAVVVGSGISGGWAAKQLTERGLRVLVLEAGGPVEPDRDYVEHVPPWHRPFRGLRDYQKQVVAQPIQRLSESCDEWVSHFFVDDREHPYTTPQDQPFVWIRSRQVGGRSIVWGRQTYRLSDLDLTANERDGHGADWPIRSADLAPWYDHVERFVGISGEALGLAQLPDSQFLPPMALNCAEHQAKEGIASKFGGQRVLTIGRCAVLTQAHQGRRACHYCGPCHRGCASRSYFSSPSSTLPAAAATGRLTLQPHTIVHSLAHDPASGRVSSARTIDAQTGATSEVYGRVFFLCASTLESTRILLNSGSERHPHGLANSSGQLGRNLMDHLYGVGAVGLMPTVKGKEAGRRPNGIYVPRFVNLGNGKDEEYLRGYGFQGAGLRLDWQQAMLRRGFGADLKHGLRDGLWVIAFLGFGECLPYAENSVTLDPEVRDRWGVPVLRIAARFRGNELAMARDIRTKALELVEASGAMLPQPFGELAAPGRAIHELGTARMGRNPETSVLNAWNQAWDARNLFVTDGSCMPSSGCQNPSLTYMALTARASAYAVRELAAGRL